MFFLQDALESSLYEKMDETNGLIAVCCDDDE